MTANTHHRTRAAAALLVCLFASCSGGGAKRGIVRGQVTLDGAPLKQGSILFVPAAGNAGVTTGGPIVDGRYELAGNAGPAVGANRVEIRSVRKSGRMVPKPLSPPGEMVEADEEAVAAEFNSASKLKADVQPGEQSLDFAVASRPVQGAN